MIFNLRFWKNALFFFLIFWSTPLVIRAEYFFKNINTDQGLSSNSVNAVLRDQKGYLWIGTNFGLNRFDGYNMKVFKQDVVLSNSLNNNYITTLSQDQAGVLWVLTKSGYAVFDYKLDKFSSDYSEVLKERGIKAKTLSQVVCGRQNTAHIVDQNAVIIYNHSANKSVIVKKENAKTKYQSGCFDNENNLWLIDSDYILYKINSSSGVILKKFSYPFNRQSYSGVNIMFVDKRNNIWIAINSSSLYFINTSTGELHDFKKSGIDSPFNRFPIRGISEDNQNKIWIGTDHGGVVLIDPIKFSIFPIQADEDRESSLSENTITALYSDFEGTVWVGTFKQGLDYYNPLNRRFTTNKIAGSSSYNDINCFAEDSEGNIFIGTNGKGLYKYNVKTGTYTPIKYSRIDKTDNTVVSLLYDSQNRLWIGTFMDGLYCYDGKQFIHYNYESPTAKLPENNIWSIMEDAEKNIWIGTLNKGLFKLDIQKGEFISIQESENRFATIECALKDKNDNLLFGSSWGIYFVNKGGKLKEIFEFDKGKDRNSYKNYVNSIAQDKNGYFWIATQGGLAILDKKNGKYHFFNSEVELDNIFVYMVVVDADNDVWISTTKGVFRIHTIDYGKLSNIKINITHFGKNDGLQDNKFNGKSALLTRQNKLIFGGVNGFNIIDPKTILSNNKLPNLVLTNLFINNKLVAIGEKYAGRTILESPLSEINRLKLRYNENTISIGFAALGFLHPEKYNYEYQLKGFDDNWISIDAKNPTASYNNLSSGTYTFKVRLKKTSGVDDDQVVTLKIEVLPPFWLSWYAYLFYMVLIAALVIFIYQYLVDRATFKLRLKQELQSRKHVEEISAMKVKFFTNLSHELRTPVSLIMLPIENMLAKNLDATTKNNLIMVLRNAKRLLFIVNQLLDFRKLEVGEITYHPLVGDLVAFVKDVTLPFMDISHNKNITLTVRSNVEELVTNFDPNKLERILFNLLSNAFKFTSNNGSVEVSIEFDETKPLPIIIKVADTGIGIDQTKIDHIFKPFYQADNQGRMADMGTGIGLSITYEFVRLHNGNIRVESELDKGTVFVIELPRIEGELPVIKEELPEIELTTENENDTLVLQDSTEKKNETVLIVEDNDDFRFYIVENLRGQYNVIEANNGAIAYEKANKFNPDIIVSDVTMPEMNGFELCSKLKSEVNTSHIPIILLTANILDEDKITGFESGADEYITKPFNVGVLQARIRNLLMKKAEQRVLIAEHHGEDLSEIQLPTLDEKLLEKVLKYTNEKMSDSDFGVEELSREIGMSSVYLNKKISALTGKTTSEYMRFIRLKKAAQLLEKTELTVSEVAYEVGYNSPKYFSKYFKDEFGILPSDFKKRQK